MDHVTLVTAAPANGSLSFTRSSACCSNLQAHFKHDSHSEGWSSPITLTGPGRVRPDVVLRPVCSVSLSAANGVISTVLTRRENDPVHVHHTEPISLPQLACWVIGQHSTHHRFRHLCALASLQTAVLFPHFDVCNVRPCLSKCTLLAADPLSTISTKQCART